MDYQLAVIDPPWSWAAWGKEQTREVPYPVLTLPDLRALPISSLLAQDSVVLLWVTDPLLPHAMRCVEDWGLTFKTVGFYWTKTRASGKEHIGLGYYTRANPEQCWILTQGKGLPRQSRAVRRWLQAPFTKHSEKPDQFYEAVDQLFGPVKRVDVFARKPRPGWDSIGNEIDGKDIREVLPIAWSIV